MKKFSVVLRYVLAVVFGLAGLLAAVMFFFPDEVESSSFSSFNAFFAVVFLALAALLAWTAKHHDEAAQKRAQKKAEKAQKQALKPVPDPMALDKYIGANFAIVSGLNLPAGIRCSVQLMGDHLSIRAQNQEFTLSNGKIVSVMVHTAKEVQQQYVSSVGGAVAGLAILGPLGAILGGAATKKTITNKTPLLIFAYQNNGEDVQYLIFNAESSPWDARRFVKAYRGLTKSRTITTEL